MDECHVPHDVDGSVRSSPFQKMLALVKRGNAPLLQVNRPLLSTRTPDLELTQGRRIAAVAQLWIGRKRRPCRYGT